MMLALKMIYDYQHYALEPLQRMRATVNNAKRIDEKKIMQHYQRFINQKGRRMSL